MKRVAIYIRVSTLDQAREGYSLAAQRKSLEAWAEARGYTVVYIYEDAGISGKDIKHRPAMLQLLDAARLREFDIVLVWSLSRLTRSMADLYNTWSLLTYCGIELVSYTEAFDTSTPTGRAMMGVLGVFAQFERENTAERVMAALTERAEQGKRTCTEVLGYDPHGDTFTVNETEAERVRYIFDRYKEYKNLSAVSELCKLKGYTGKRGRLIQAEGIKKILTLPLYAGYNRFNGQLYKGNHPPIISAKEFNKVQQIIWGNKKAGRKRTKSTDIIVLPVTKNAAPQDE